METALSWLEPRDRWKGWEAVFGPSIVLLTCALSVLANSVWGRMIGDVACGWRLGYSPRGPAFGIWSIIYLWSFLSILFQFLTNMNHDRWYCADFGANVLIGVAWLACSLWIYFFSEADSRNVKDGLGWAAICLVTAAVCAVSAVIWEMSWRSQDAERILTVGVPYGIFAGWLSLAASLSTGVYVSSQSRAPDPCDDDLVQVREIESWEYWAPTGVAIAAACIAISLPDPMLMASVSWGALWMPPGVRVWVGSAASLGFVAAVVRVVLM